MNSSKVYIILGPPGSGKGTQAKKLAQSLGSIYFGTGDLMRDEESKGTPLGLEFKKVWDAGKGELIRENLVQKFIGQKIDEIDISQGIIFDGYPRTISQAKHLEGILSQKGINNPMVLNLVVDTEHLIKRMETRRVCETCKKVFQDPGSLGLTHCDDCSGVLVQREEDKPEVLRKRIDVYNQQTAPLVGYYKSKGSLIEIDGEPPIKEVWKEIQRKIRNPND